VIRVFIFKTCTIVEQAVVVFFQILKTTNSLI